MKWFSKKEMDEARYLEAQGYKHDKPEAKEAFECAVCRCLMLTPAKTIKVNYVGSKRHYCGRCAPAYDWIHSNVDGIKYWKKQPDIQCDKDGNPIKEQA